MWTSGSILRSLLLNLDQHMVRVQSFCLPWLSLLWVDYISNELLWTVVLKSEKHCCIWFCGSKRDCHL
ncbi:hypothetical protein L1887_33554 [Cichorium endivia]|nr:hypothetical protein L1887_33554 [Cichorium endivia]